LFNPQSNLDGFISNLSRLLKQRRIMPESISAPTDVTVRGGASLYDSKDQLILGYHEEAHTNQWREMGAVGFLWNWAKGGGASSSNPLENDSAGGANDIARQRQINEGIHEQIQNIPLFGRDRGGIFYLNSEDRRAGVYQ
jgi:hypothetical protein